MCDNDRNGVIDKGELSEMLRSLVEIARTTSLSDDHVTELIEGMFQVRITNQLYKNFNLIYFCLILYIYFYLLSYSIYSFLLILGCWLRR